MPRLPKEGGTEQLTERTNRGYWDRIADTAVCTVYLKGVNGFKILDLDSNGNVVPLPAQVDKSLSGLALVNYLLYVDKQLGGLLSISAKYRSGRKDGLPSGTIYVNDKLIDFSTWETIEGWSRMEVKRIYSTSEQLIMDKLKEMYKKFQKG